MSPKSFLTVIALLLASVTSGWCDSPSDGTVNQGSVPVSPILVVQRPHRRLVAAVAYSPDSKTVASLSWDETLKLSSVRSGAVLRNLPGHYDSVMSLAFSPDGKLLASGGSTGGSTSSTGDIEFWDVQSGALVSKVPSFGGWVFTVEFLRGGRVLGVVAYDADKPSALKDKKTAAARPGPGPIISFWDISASASTPRLLRKIDTHTGPYFAPAFSDIGHSVAVAYEPMSHGKAGNTYSRSSQTIVKMWDTDTGALKSSWPIGTEPAYSLKFAPDGKTLVSGGDNRTLRLWDVASGKLGRTFKGGDDDVDALLNYGWQGRLAVGEASGGPKLSARARMRQMVAGGVDAIAFSPDGRLLASAQGIGLTFIKIRDLGTGQVVARFTIPLGQRLDCLAFSPDGNSLVGAGGSSVYAGDQASSSMSMWDVRLMRSMWERHDSAWEVGTSEISSSGQALSITFPQYARQQLWDLRLGRLANEAVIPGGAEAFSPDGKLLALTDTSKGGYAVQLRDARTDRVTKTLLADSNYENGSILDSLVFSADGRNVAAYCLDVRIWNVASGKIRAVLDTQADAAAFSPDGKILATLQREDDDGDNSSAKLMLWNLATRKSIWTRKQPEFMDGSVLYSGDGRTLATIYSDGSIHLINVGNGKDRVVPKAFSDHASEATAKPFCHIDFGPDGHSLQGVTALGHVLTLDLGSGKVTTSGAELPWGNYQIYRAPHQTMLVDVDCNVVKFWNPDSGKLLLTIDNFGILQDKWGDTTVWLAHTPDGHYCGPSQGTSFIRWNVDGQLYPADRFHQQFYEPGLIARVLNGPA